MREQNTLQKLSKFYPQVSATCWRCGKETGSLFHLFWTFKCITRFWMDVNTLITKLADLDLSDNPTACLLHLLPVSCPTYEKSLTIHLLKAAKACIPCLFKASSPPTIGQQIARVNDIMLMCDWTAALRGDTFQKIWRYWKQFRESQVYPLLLNCPGS